MGFLRRGVRHVPVVSCSSLKLQLTEWTLDSYKTRTGVNETTGRKFAVRSGICMRTFYLQGIKISRRQPRINEQVISRDELPFEWNLTGEDGRISRQGYLLQTFLIYLLWDEFQRMWFQPYALYKHAWDITSITFPTVRSSLTASSASVFSTSNPYMSAIRSHSPQYSGYYIRIESNSNIIIFDGALNFYI